ncbi:DUF7133 domain-containing protein [Horticoccus sp. 23ND18S-11]|uniref:DUF7133 domain-containing protein n=1 Tax=Horticoccus sp. 23ND18S-11 TaxID=3391832 RepID=UPI0039C93A04
MTTPRLLPSLRRLVLAAFVILIPARAAEPLFDGTSLAGWEGDLKWWRVQDGALTGGSLTEKVPRNFFLATTRSFQNFDLTLQLKLTGVPNTGMINSGVQIRSLRVPGDTEMSGYQVDAGEGWWGKLYDESRRNKVIAESANLPAVTRAVKPGEWNEMRIRTEGPRIRSWINGVPALDYVEPDAGIAHDGHIAVQIHSGGMALVQVKDVRIDVLPTTPGAPTWEQVGPPKPRAPAPKKGPNDAAKKKSATAPAATAPAPGRDLSYNAITDGPRSPEDQRRAFKLPDGFEMELVAAESEGLGKFITVTWDAQMRLWSMTALEYPVDANENKKASEELFARGGRDRVVVFDDPYGANVGGAKPRVFADGLVMPLGVQPYKDGAYVQYGTDIRFYRDKDGDGRAEGHETILTGFGTQDSHLFPHQFLRQPGGWMFVAQGLFNYSTVRRPDGAAFADGTTAVPFNQCKLARFTLDGSRFENVTAGPNNIWGLVTARDGETFLQEANDMGYPVVPYAPGIQVRTGSKDLLRPYQPLMPPPLGPAQMGGTGLSGLALAEDRDDRFRAAAGAISGDTKVFYLANPITGTIQLVKAVPEGPRYRYEKLSDFVTTTDRWFRPIAVHFGPDGALYIVDWYNKIISHNEVPRSHPDRDKLRGRIWRVRHRDQPRTPPPDLTRLDDRALLAQLGGPNALVSRLAWLEIADRRATSLVPALAAIVAERTTPLDRRLAALWALEGLQPVPAPLLATLAADPHPACRREAVRLAAVQARSESDFIALAAPLADDPHPAVRAAVGDALRRVAGAGPALMQVAARLGRASLGGSAGEWERYEREFERYLARWAMERNAAATRTLLESAAGQSLPLESRVLATLALGGREAALGLARFAPALNRPLGDEEVRTLAAQGREPEVAAVLATVLDNSATRVSVLRALLAVRTSLDASALLAPLTTAARALLELAAPADVTLGAELAGAFKLAGVEPALVSVVKRDLAATPPTLAALRALRELGAGPAGLFAEIVRAPATPAARDEAVAALAASRSPDAIKRLVDFLPTLPARPRGLALDRLASSTAGAQALIEAVDAGALPRTALGLGSVEKMRTVLPAHPLVASLWRELNGEARRVLRLPGGREDFPDTRLTVAGPFTIESWLKLDAEITQRDGLIGAPGQFDLNFFDGRFRVWLPEANDVVIATKKAAPGVWTHYAVTRDDRGIFRLYLDGELNGTSAATSNAAFTDLRLGRTRTDPTGGVTAGWLAEYRVWNVARSAADIRENFDRSFADLSPAERPAALTHSFSNASWGVLLGAARIEIADDAPTLLTQAEAAAQAEKFARFRTLANTRGNPDRGRELFSSICLACHQQGGKGGQIAPALDGVALTGVEALLRNLLTPSAAMESAYQTFRVVMNDGSVTDGFLAEQSADALVLRLPGAADRRIARRDVKQAAYLRRSLMPEGLLEGLAPEQVTDLFAHLKSLR